MGIIVNFFKLYLHDYVSNFIYIYFWIKEHQLNNENTILISFCYQLHNTAELIT